MKRLRNDAASEVDLGWMGALNRAIRELWARSDGRLTADEQRIYQALVLRWAAAQQGDVGTAA